jgi:FK506-binding protein 1
MGVEKVVLKRGNGNDVPKKHDEVSMEYTGSTIFSRVTTPYLTNHAGWLHSDEVPDKKGKQ